MFPAWTWIVGFWVGAAVGSFLNVVIYRLPRGLSVSKPKNSFCPTCKHRLGLLDLVPILSWVFLGGKCRHCKARVSSRYILVELINATIWAVIWYQVFVVKSDPLLAGHLSYGEATAYALAYSLFASALVAAIFTDLAHYIIPDQVNAFMLFVGVGLNAALIWMGSPEAWLWGMPSSVAGALVGWGVLWGIALFGRIVFGKDAMGHGDIKMARGMGAVLLPVAALMSFGVAVVLGALGGIAVIAHRSRSKDKRPGFELFTASDQQLRKHLVETRVSLLKGQADIAQRAVVAAGMRANQLADGKMVGGWLNRLQLGRTIKALAKLTESIRSGHGVQIQLSCDPPSFSLPGEMSSNLFNLLVRFETAMNEEDLAGAESILHELPTAKLVVHADREDDRESLRLAVESANRKLDRIGLTITASNSIANAAIVFTGSDSTQTGPTAALAVKGTPTERDLVVAALEVTGTRVPFRFKRDKASSVGEMIDKLRETATRNVALLPEIKRECTEVHETGAKPVLMFTESYGSLMKCGIGYVLCIDVIGLRFTTLYENWFGENPYEDEGIEDEPVVELGKIPFGPYLAAGALVALLANDWLMGLWDAYATSVGLQKP